jgi:hypothetical protein
VAFSESQHESGNAPGLTAKKVTQYAISLIDIARYSQRPVTSPGGLERMRASQHPYPRKAAEILQTDRVSGVDQVG